MPEPAPPPHETPPPQPDTPVQQSEPTAKSQSIRHLEFKATVLLVFTLLLVAGAALYLLYARGFFEPKQTLVLITDNSEGVVPGMDLTFSGFPIGRVRSVELGEQGNVRVTVDVLKHDAHWLRTSSVFTLVKGLVGAPQLRAYTGMLNDPPLPEGAERAVLRGDANEELQRAISTARDLVENLSQIAAPGSDLNLALGNLQTFTDKLQGNRGALHAIFGNEDDARKLVAAIERANAAMARIESMAGKAETQFFGAGGLVSDAQGTAREFQRVLGDARNSLQRVDAVLIEAQGVGANLRTGTADLGSLRGEVESNLRKVEDMINELNRRWPFAKEPEVKLP